MAQHNIVDLTYSQLQSLIGSNGLIRGILYNITDYATMYYQPDYDSGGNLKSSCVFKTETIEPLIVEAISTNTLSDIAYSPLFPKDKIKYDATITSAFNYGGALPTHAIKGRIIERIDEWGNRTEYDHRTVKFIRYDDGSGNYTVINDNSNSSEEFLTFGSNYANGGIITDNYMNGFYYLRDDWGFEFNNIVILGGFVISNNVTGVCYNNTFSGDVNSNTFSGDVNSNTFSGGIGKNLFSGSLGKNLFSGDVSNNTFSGSVNSNTFSGDVFNNTFSGSVDSNTFSGSVNSNIFSGSVADNTFSGNVSNNTFSGSVDSNTFSGKVASNTFSGNVDSSTFSGGVSNNTFSGSVNSSTFSGDVSNNTFSGDVYRSTFSGDVYRSTFSGSVNDNTFTHTSALKYTDFNGNISSKTISESLYPDLFGADYKKEVFLASNSSVYYKYFDGITDTVTQIV